MKIEIYNDKTGEIRTLLKKEGKKLTPRQFQILNFALNFISTKFKKHKIVPLISQEFGIKEQQARNHVNRIVKKVDWLDTYNWVFTEETKNSLGNSNHSKSLTLQILKKKLVIKLKKLYKSFKNLYLKKGSFLINLAQYKFSNIIFKLYLGIYKGKKFLTIFNNIKPIYKYVCNAYLLKKRKINPLRIKKN